MLEAKVYERINSVAGSIYDHDLPTRWFSGSVIHNRDGSMAVGWELQPFNPTLLSADRITTIFQQIRSAIQVLPEHFDVQFMLVKNSSWRKEKSIIEKNLQQSDNPIVDEFVRSEMEVIDKRFLEHDLSVYRAWVFLVRSCTLRPGEVARRIAETNQRGSGKASKLSTWMRAFFLPMQGMVRYSSEEYDKAIEDLATVATGFGAGLQNAFLNPKLLETPDLIKVFYMHWNFFSYEDGNNGPDVVRGEDRPAPLYFARTPFEWDPKGREMPRGVFRLDGGFNQILSMGAPAEMLEFPQMMPIVFNHRIKSVQIVINMRRGDIERRKKRLREKLPQIQNSVEKRPDLMPQVEEIQTELETLGRGSEGVWEAAVYFRIWDRDYKVLDERSMELARIGESMGGVSLIKETWALWEYWRCIQPGWTRDTDRYRELPYTTTQVTTQVPVCGETTGLEDVKSPRDLGAILETRAGSIFNFNPFDQKRLTNYNGIIIGGAGTGKSVFAGSLMARLMRPNTRVTMIDLGGSYERLCQCMKGLYVCMDIRSEQNRINPLFMEHGANDVPDPEDLATKIIFLEKLIVDPQKEKRLSREQQSILSEALTQLYRSTGGKEFFLSSLRQILMRMGADGKLMAARLGMWCGDGAYAKLFDGPSQIQLDNPFTVFDLTSVKKNQDLLPVMFTTLINYVTEAGRMYRGVDKFLIFDEAAVLMEDPIVASFMEMAYRTMRKLGFSVIGISQGIEEWTKIPNRNAILENLSNIIVLRQDTNEGAATLCKELNLGEGAEEIVRGLVSIPGQFSEALVYQRTNAGLPRATVVVNRLTPIGYAMFTTNGRDVAKIEEFQRTMPMVEAIKAFAEKYPRGVNQE